MHLLNDRSQANLIRDVAWLDVYRGASSLAFLNKLIQLAGEIAASG